jgi:hypothetical protein
MRFTTLGREACVLELNGVPNRVKLPFRYCMWNDGRAAQLPALRLMRHGSST